MHRQIKFFISYSGAKEGKKYNGIIVNMIKREVCMWLWKTIERGYGSILFLCIQLAPSVSNIRFVLQECLVVVLMYEGIESLRSTTASGSPDIPYFLKPS